MPVRIKNIDYTNCINKTVQTCVRDSVRMNGHSADLTCKPDVFQPALPDLLSQPCDKILAAVKDAIKNADPFQFGAQSSVYKIPDTQYAVQVPHGKTIGRYASVSFDLTKKERLNHLAAKLGNKIYLKRFVEGITTKAPYTEKATPFGMISVVDEAAQYRINGYVKDLAPESFKNLYNQIFEAMNNGLAYDCFGENLILNPKTKKLTAIDFDTMDNSYKFNPYAEIYHSFSVDDIKEQKALLYKITAGFLQSVTDKKCVLNDFSQIEISMLCDKYNLFKRFDDKDFLMKLNDTLSEAFENCKLLRQNNL